MENLRSLLVGMDQRGFFDSIGTPTDGKASCNSWPHHRKVALGQTISEGDAERLTTSI